MNMQALMQQAQKMQRDLTKKKDELNKKEFNGTSELVDVVFTGDKKLVSVNIKEADITSDDKEILEDMIMVALNDAFKQVDKETEKKMGKYANAMPGLF